MIQTFLAKIFLDFNDQTFSLSHNEDAFLFLFFVLFYLIFIKLLSKYYSININQIVVSIGLIISGFVLCLIFVLLLDLQNNFFSQIKFNKTFKSNKIYDHACL